MKTIALYDIKKEIGYPKNIEMLSQNSEIIWCLHGSGL